MTTALTSTPTALTAAASPFASMSGRVKPLDPQELLAVSEAIAQAQDQLSAQSTAATAQAQQQIAATAAQAAGTMATAPAATTPTLTAVGTIPSSSAAAPVATAAAATPAVAATSAATTASGAVAVPASTIAPRTKYDYWTKHIAQFAGKYLPDGPTMKPNCGPASVTMALRMVGLDIPGFSGQNSEAVLDKARIIATGRNDASVGTTDTELEKLISASGAKWSESTDFAQVTSWIKQGIPVVLSGNPAKGWDARYANSDVQHFDGGHWVTVSGYDEASGYYIVNDPLSQIGPIYVSEQELRNYNSAHGKLGIAVFR